MVDDGRTRRLVLVGVMGVSGLAAFWSLRLAWADHLSRTAGAGVMRAIALAPGDAGFQLRLAATREAGGDDPTAALAEATRLDPGNTTAWMRLGLSAEMRGDFPAAERNLLQAARVSRQFEPRWTLANYYIRRDDPAQARPWLKESLRLAYGDPSPVFQLGWKAYPDAASMLARAIPDSRATLHAYLLFLVQENHMAAAEPIARRLSAVAQADDRAALLGYCDRNLDARAANAVSVRRAVDLWNDLCARRLLPYSQLDYGGGALTDGNFATPALGDAFGWRRPELAGVASPAGSRLSFSGAQPEYCEPLAQLLPLSPRARYRLRFEYRTSGILAASGLRWRLFESPSGADLAAGAPWLSSAEWKPDELRFSTMAATCLVRLSLTLERLPGATRIQGSIDLRGLVLERLP